MSEMKVILATPHLKMKNACDGAIEVCLKSEVDKVIAELNQKINEAQTELELWRDGSIISEAHQKELDGKRHSDYKRCLAMARWCEEVDLFGGYTSNYWMRWRNKWLKLAERFKEVK